jgi:feruloyl esterase
MTPQQFTGLALALMTPPLLASANSTATQPCEQLTPPANVIFEKTPGWQQPDDLPRFCQVRGQIEGRTRFELRLPEDWNGRFVMAGCGGFCGSLQPDKKGHSNSINEALKKGYAAISHDGGHTSKSWETDWAYEDPTALELYAHRILPQVTGAGTELTTQLYGQPPEYRYFSGCSNGGRLGMMAAQRYPGLFDGIAAGGGIFSISQIAGLWGNWMIQQTGAESEPVFNPQKNPLIKQAILKQCDTLDGLADGVITDPRQCQFDFKTLQCDNNEDTEHCLTPDESAMLSRLYGGVLDKRGQLVSPALSFGSEHYTDIWLFGSLDKPAWGSAASRGYRQLLSHNLFSSDSHQPVSTDTMQQWIEQSTLPALTDADNPDLTSLARHKTKLMIYHGWSDPLIIPQPMVDYYEQASEHSGGLEKLKENARLYMVPGWGHCWERPAETPAEFDPLEIVANWVEQGKAPESFIASQRSPLGELLRQRPICAYPQVANLVNRELPNRADSYRCGPPVAPAIAPPETR